jgi:hypothetical protein
MAGVLAIVVAAAACGGLRARHGTPRRSGFLGDYAELQHLEGYDAQLLYINPSAVWSRYDAVHIDSVTLWANVETGRLSDHEKQHLTDDLYAGLHGGIGRSFRMVDRPGPGVLRLRAALTEAKGANTPLDTLTAMVPPPRDPSTPEGVSPDLARAIGHATVEVELTDSITGERLAAAVDERAGEKAFSHVSTWSDVEMACGFWGERVRRFLLRQGVHPLDG